MDFVEQNPPVRDSKETPTAPKTTSLRTPSLSRSSLCFLIRSQASRKRYRLPAEDQENVPVRSRGCGPMANGSI